MQKLACVAALMALSSNWASEPSLKGMGEGIDGGECQHLESVSSREWLIALELSGVTMTDAGARSQPVKTVALQEPQNRA